MGLKLKKKLTQTTLHNISSRMTDHIPRLLEYFKIEAEEHSDRFAFPCPIHGGDNPNGCCIYRNGVWQCWTNNCHEEYKNSFIGFIRAMLCVKRNKSVSLDGSVEFCEYFLGENVADMDDNSAKTEIDSCAIFRKQPEKIGTQIERATIRAKLDIPSNYYINRGFLANTLDKFDVGLCLEAGKPMSNRVVVPIYDQENDYVGCAGRSINEQLKPKWLYSKGFKKCVLYGFNLAKEHILRTQAVILVEGQGDVWRMYEAGYPQSVGIFGCSLTDDQLLLLESSGALNVIVLTDSDNAGEKAYQQIVKKCGRRFNYTRPKISSKDVGDMSIQQIKEELVPQLKGVIK
jgi:5S rRNA maturation endonuclease (ribonuclease M5)